MKLTIDFSNPIIPEKDVLGIRPSDLDDFYIHATDLDKNNLFYLLLNSAHYYERNYDWICAAHLYFLAANYLFISLTPLASFDLAMHYMKKAVELNPSREYLEWLALMEKGN